MLVVVVVLVLVLLVGVVVELTDHTGVRSEISTGLIVDVDVIAGTVVVEFTSPVVASVVVVVVGTAALVSLVSLDRTTSVFWRFQARIMREMFGFTVGIWPQISKLSSKSALL